MTVKRAIIISLGWILLAAGIFSYLFATIALFANGIFYPFMALYALLGLVSGYKLMSPWVWRRAKH